MTKQHVALLAMVVSLCACAPVEDAPEAQTGALNQQGDGVTTNLEVPLIVEFFRDENFEGPSRVILEDTPWFGGLGFNDAASSVRVHPGLAYDAWKQRNPGQEPSISLYVNEDYNTGGRPPARLTVGTYPNLSALGYQDNVSSARLNDPNFAVSATPTGTAALRYVDVIVDVYIDTDLGGRHMTLIESTTSLNEMFGSMWNDSISSVRFRCARGCRRSAVSFYGDRGLGGSGPSGYFLATGFPSTMNLPGAINDRTSSIAIQY